jgi:hypothetical protein
MRYTRNSILGLFMIFCCSMNHAADWATERFERDRHSNHSKLMLETILLEMPLCEAHSNLTVAKQILDEGVSPNLVERGHTVDSFLVIYGHSILAIAIAKRRKEFVQFLLDNGADIEITTAKQPWTPLMGAVSMSGGNNDIVKLLINRGANVNACTQKKSHIYSPLFNAFIHYNIDLIKILLDAGADPNQDLFGKPLLVRMREYRSSLTTFRTPCHQQITTLLSKRICSQVSVNAIVLIRAAGCQLPSEVWEKIIRYFELEDAHRIKLITYLNAYSQ